MRLRSLVHDVSTRPCFCLTKLRERLLLVAYMVKEMNLEPEENAGWYQIEEAAIAKGMRSLILYKGELQENEYTPLMGVTETDDKDVGVGGGEGNSWKG